MAETGPTFAAAVSTRDPDELDPDIRGLLNHIAAELAEEYVRLMEAAAQADASPARNEEEPD